MDDSPHDRVVKALTHKPVDRVPRDIWALPGVPVTRPEDFNRLHTEFPSDFEKPAGYYGEGERVRGVKLEKGEYIDAYGSLWYAAQTGIIGEVRKPPLEDWKSLDKYRLPRELLDNANPDIVNKTKAGTDKFVLVGTETRPFERIQFLRGTEALFLDLAYGSSEVEKLLSMLHEFYMRDLEIWSKSDADGISFMDDWGTQNAMLISPAMWRKMFKPLYKEYCEIIHSGGKYVFFHTDGFVEDIIPDLIEIGVDALNSQLFCMDIERIGEEYSGKVTFWGEIDRQNVLPFGSEDDVRNAVRRVRAAFDKGNGGVIAQAEFGMNDPYENIRAVFDEWSKPWGGEK